ncbi:hypothetical protein [Nocardioides mesophilus]|uniref:Extradiol ring-cleavage dioxygenase class III enzyme subunit B domain-containing protein n=1 Tax=Nocardioides mesophilus TaxID=433659 RepID=A0A7G9R6W9_9ACTN|nr:hypothetical protein [Nocardioides mesophilus]QNN51344.1 hypothetical protein H9L09_12020 [Nocardioides mesophilus]
MSGPLRVVLCPHPPLLFRELAGLQDAAADLRVACRTALETALAAAPDEVVVVGGAEESRRWEGATAADVRRFGTTAGRTGPGLPLSLGVGSRLLQEAGWTGPTRRQTVVAEAPDHELDALAAELRGRTGALVLLLGEGSTRRGEKAPGFLDERAFPFDDAVAAALSGGDAAALRDLDAGLAAELAVSGGAVLRLLGRLVTTPVAAELSYRDDPFGVSWFVATWDARTPSDSAQRRTTSSA